MAISQGRKVLFEKSAEKSFSHSENITLLISECLKESGLIMKDLNGVVVSAGPGSYTGLRVGTAVAKAICFSRRIPLISVSSLESLAHGVNRELIEEHDIILSTIDARRMELYACYLNERMEIVKDVHTLILTDYGLDLFSDYSKVIVVGDGAEKTVDYFKSLKIVNGCVLPNAAYMCKPALKKFENADFENLYEFEPNYFKPPNITKSKKTFFPKS